jgi:hypothetical protein
MIFCSVLVWVVVRVDGLPEVGSVEVEGSVDPRTGATVGRPLKSLPVKEYLVRVLKY